MRGLHLAVVLLLASATLLPTPSLAGTAEAPELTDASGDQAVQRTLPVVPSVNDDTFADVDIRAAWLTTSPGPQTIEGPATNLTVTVRFGAPWRDASRLTIGLKTEPGPTSVVGTRAQGTVFNATIVGLTPSGNATAASRTGNDLVITFVADRFGVFNAVGGDLVTITDIAANRANAGSLPVAQDDSSGSDSATGASAFTMPRPAPVAGASLSVLGGTIRSQPPRTFTGAQATVDDELTAVDFRIRLANNGTDADTFSYGPVPPSKDAPSGAAETSVPVTLLPGESHERTVTIRFLTNPEDSRPDGDRFAVNVTVTSQRGASAAVEIRLVLDLPDVAPPPPTTPAAPREPKPVKLEFLTPAAEGLRFDGPFDEYAEAALMAVIVLLCILAVFLALYLGHSSVQLAPEGEAPPLASPREPDLFIPTAALTRAELEADAPEARRSLANQPPPAPVPFVPVREELALSIEAVQHDPERPDEGQEVETSVLLRNDGPASAHVRVVLAVADHDAAQVQAIVPGGSSKTVRLEWTAGPGDNRVRVQVFPT